MVDVQAPEQPSGPNDEELPYRMGFTWPRGLAIAAVVAMIIFWIWIFSGAPAKDNPDRLRTDSNAQLLLDRSPLGDSVDKAIQIFTQVNEIPVCDTPGDVG